jgi:hypothetical protein
MAAATCEFLPRARVRAGGKVKTARIGSTWFLPAVGGYYRLRDSLDRLVA